MICPYCGKEMTLGYIYGDRSRIKWIRIQPKFYLYKTCKDRTRIKWISKEDDQGIVLTWFSKGIILTDFVENKLEVHYCKYDEVFIIKRQL